MDRVKEPKTKITFKIIVSILGIAILVLSWIIAIATASNYKTLKDDYTKLESKNIRLEKELEAKNSSKSVDLYGYNYSSFSNEIETFSGNESYWFVYYEKKGGNIRFTTFVMQDQPHFSHQEFIDVVGDDKFMINFHRVSKGTYELNKDE